MNSRGRMLRIKDETFIKLKILSAQQLTTLGDVIELLMEVYEKNRGEVDAKD